MFLRHYPYGLELLDDGTVLPWGSAPYGQTEIPSDVVNVTKVAAGYYHACAIVMSGNIKCWGRTVIGGALEDDPDPVIYKIPQLDHPTEIAIGTEEACAIDRNGVICWGDSVTGFKTVLPLFSKPKNLVMAGNFGCALDSDDSLKCWGASSTPGTGMYQCDASKVPSDLGKVSALSAEMDSTRAAFCAIGEKGPECWDPCDEFTSWHPGNLPRMLPSPPSAVAGATMIANTSYNACVGGTFGIQCWVLNPLVKDAPFPSPGLQNIKKIIMGSSKCFIDSLGLPECWASRTTFAPLSPQICENAGSSNSSDSSVFTISNGSEKLILGDDFGNSIIFTHCLLNQDGSTYAFNGITADPLTGLASGSVQILKQYSPNSSIIAGKVGGSLGGGQLFLARVLADGTLDSTFSEKGYLTETLTDIASALNVQAVNINADGSVTITGNVTDQSSSDFVSFTVSYSSNGTLLSKAIGSQ